MAKTETRPWDAADRLESVDEMVAYLEAALDEGDAALFAAALGDVARAKGMTETARRAGLVAPYSCESGSCATCMALLHEGSVAMRVNNALTPDEVAEGWVLTCQSVPTSSSVRIEYEQL